MDGLSWASRLGLLKTWGLGVLSSTGSSGGTKDDLRVPGAFVEAAEPSVQRVNGQWQPEGALVGEARGPLLQTLEGLCSQGSQR